MHMKKSSLLLTGAGILAFALLAHVGVLHAQDMSPAGVNLLLQRQPIMQPPTSTEEMSPSPTSTQPLPPPEPTFFSATGTEGWHPTSTDMTMEHPTSTHPVMPPTFSGSQMNQDENVVVSSDDTAAIRAAKLARYWSVYREVGSNSIFAITTSGTKREIQTLTFFTGISANFGIKLMPKGSLDQFTTADPITSTEGLDPSQFRKAPQPCRLIKTANMPAVYLACLGVKRVILNERAFHQFGWNFNQVKTVASTELNSMKAGDNVDESTVFDQGVTIDTSGIAASGSTGSQPPKPSTVNPQSTAKVNGITSTKGAKIVKLQGGTKIFILTADGKKHLLTNMDVVRALKLNLSKVQIMTQDQLNAYPDGTPITLGTGGKESTSPSASPSAKATGDRLTPTTPPMMPPVSSEHPTATSTGSHLPTMGEEAKVAFLLKASGTSGPVYLVKLNERIKHQVLNSAALTALGLNIQPLQETTQSELDTLQTGDPIGTAPATPSGTPSAGMPLNPEAASTSGNQTGTDLSSTTTSPTMPNTM